MARLGLEPVTPWFGSLPTALGSPACGFVVLLQRDSYLVPCSNVFCPVYHCDHLAWVRESFSCICLCILHALLAFVIFSSHWCHGLAMACDCGTLWTCHLIFRPKPDDLIFEHQRVLCLLQWWCFCWDFFFVSPYTLVSLYYATCYNTAMSWLPNGHFPTVSL